MYLENLLTIIIPCKNEGLTIKKTLALLNQQYLAKDVQVIIADSSDDSSYTRSVIESEMNKCVKINIIDGGLPAVARNAGAMYSSTKYVLFLDADIFLENPYLLHNMVADTDFEKKHLTTCRIRTKDIYSLVFIAFDWVRSLVVKKTPFALGGFMLFNRAEFNNIGCFNVEDKIAEDYHISKKINSSKFKVYPYTAYTTSRRFKQKGILYMIKLMLDCWFNRNNDEFYKRDYQYFQ